MLTNSKDELMQEEKEELELELVSYPKIKNKLKEDIHIRVIYAWIRRHIENGNLVKIRESEDKQNYECLADTITHARISIMFDNIKRKGSPQFYYGD